jgi:hypothetical protein
MFDRTREITAASSAIYLEYGADEADCEQQEVGVCGRGLSFKSRWKFPLGTELAVVISFRDADGSETRVSVEGVIVECEPVSAHCWRTVLAFVDLSDDIRARVDDLASHLPHRADF